MPRMQCACVECRCLDAMRMCRVHTLNRACHAMSCLAPPSSTLPCLAPPSCVKSSCPCLAPPLLFLLAIAWCTLHVMCTSSAHHLYVMCRHAPCCRVTHASTEHVKTYSCSSRVCSSTCSSRLFSRANLHCGKPRTPSF